METYEEHYASLQQTLNQHMPGADLALIHQAVAYARQKHQTQLRKDGSPYIIHPLSVAEIVAEMGLDTDAVLGALLHDCIEDTDATHDEIARLFGEVDFTLINSSMPASRYTASISFGAAPARKSVPFPKTSFKRGASAGTSSG